MISRLLEIPCPRDVRGEIAPVELRSDAIPDPLDHQGGHVYGRQRPADVDVPDHRRHPQERAGVHRQPLEAREQFPRVRRPRLARQVPVDAVPLALPVGRDLAECREHDLRLPPHG